MQTAQFELHADIEDRHWWFVARRQILRRLVSSVVPVVSGRTIVDVGCGTGANLAALAGDYRCVGVDTSARAIELARQRFDGIDFRQGFAPEAVADVLPEASLVLLTDVLEHVPDDFHVFSSLVAATQPGAYFLVTVPADASLWTIHDESFGHYRRYDRKRFSQIWETLPLRPLLFSHYNSRLYPAIKLIRWANRRRGGTGGKAGTDFSLPGDRTNRLLTRVFAGEASPLLRCLKRGGQAYDRGVSLLALLQRTPGDCPVRHKPAQIAPDLFDPQLATLSAGATAGLCS